MKRETSFLFLGFFLITTIAFSQQHQIDSLLIVLSKSQEDTNKVNTLNTLSDLVYRTDPIKAIIFGKEATKLAELLDYQKGLAFALKNIGLGYFVQSNYVEASIFWEQSLKIFESIQDETAAANVLSNMGSAYTYMGDDAKAIDYLLRSLKVAEKIGDSLRMATCLMNIGGIYSYIPETIDKALPYYQRALTISESINYSDGIGFSLSDLGDYYFQKELYDSALFYFERSLNYRGSIDMAASLNNIGKIHAVQGDFQSAIKYQKEALDIAEKIDGKLEMAQIFLGLANTYQKQGNIKFAIDHFEKAKKIAEEIELNYELKDAFEGLSSIYAELSDYQNAFKFQSLLRETEKSIYNIETDDKIKNLQFSFQLEKKEDEIEKLEQKSEIEQLRTKRQKLVKNISLAGGGVILVITFILYRSYKHKVMTNKLLDQQNEEIESLLLNILPAEIAKELQKDGYATPRYYDRASVLFTDFKGFTKIAEGLKPHELIAELNSFFNAFDDIVEKYKLEKIKTIGDAYMCAGGIPTVNETHPTRIVMAGLEMQEHVRMKNEQRTKQGIQTWELRVGIHTGPIVAGVVGKKKYAYDIWGDTVNIASRMESNGEVGKVNVSAATYELVKDQFVCTYRGKIEAKNKGLIDMYFIGKENGLSQA